MLVIRDLFISALVTQDVFSTPIPSEYCPTKDAIFTGIFAQIYAQTTNVVQIWTRKSGIFGCTDIISGVSLNGTLLYL